MGKGKDKEDGPSKNQLRGLSYTQEKPKFLRNIAAALGGPREATTIGRPPIPTRPDDDPNGDPEDDEDGFHNNDLGEEAPQVVVLKEGRHMTAEEAELAKKDIPPDSIKAAKRDASLRFSSSQGGSKRKARTFGAEDEEEGEGGDSFDNLLKRAKTDPTAATLSDINKRRGVQEKPIETEPDEAVQKTKVPLTKEEKAAMKAKRKASKKLLSFED